MIIWTYMLDGGQTGQIRAADDDEAWNTVKKNLGQYPVKLRAIGVDNSAEVAA